jgi:carbon storage regulator CsrA
MLVLTRRPNEAVLFPSLGISVQVVSARPGAVRLGIDAPKNIPVLREELFAEGTSPAPPDAEAESAADRGAVELSRVVGNRLRIANLGLAILEKQLDDGLVDDARITLERIRQDMRMLRDRVQSPEEKLKEPSALVVEDDRDLREVLAHFLRSAGIRTATAGDGTAALDYVRTQGPPDFILLDMLLPRWDGVATARTLRRDPGYSDMKIFALTGQSPEDLGIEPAAAGIDRWFKKPIDPQVLVRELRRELEKS